MLNPIDKVTIYEIISKNPKISSVAVSKIIGCSTSSVNRFRQQLAKVGLKKLHKNDGCRFSQEKKEQIYDLLTEGYSDYIVCKRLEVPASTVAYWRQYYYNLGIIFSKTKCFREQGKTYYLSFETTDRIIKIQNLRKWCIENDVNYDLMRQVVCGKNRVHRGIRSSNELDYELQRKQRLEAKRQQTNVI